MAAAESAWSDFTSALADVLATLQERSFLVVSWAEVPTVYVQFAQTATELQVRTGADDVLSPEHQLGTQGAERMTSLGWQPPQHDVGTHNTWHTQVSWPLRSADYERLAELTVGVFGDVHRVGGVQELEYRGWREAEPAPVGVTFYPDDLEPEEPDLSFPGLGLRNAQTD